MVSDKQLIANRDNAKKAGVKTEAGKEISSQNALKHGILAQETVIERGHVKEDSALYGQVRDALFAEVQPVGFMETMLADKLLSLYWRHRRVMIAERAMIEEQTIGHTLKRVLQRGKDAGFNRQYALSSFHDRIRTSFGCQELLEEVKAITTAIEETGLPLPEWAIDKLVNQLGLAENFSKSEALHLHHCMAKDKQGLGIKEEGLKNLTKLALRTAKEFEEFLKTGSEVWEEYEHDMDDVSGDAKALPSTEDLQKIQRYETHLHRCFMHTLHELQRLQAIRLGRPAPLTAALDVVTDAENGFVS